MNGAEGAKSPLTWRRRLAITGAIAAVHFVASYGMIASSRLLFPLLGFQNPLPRLTATLAYALMWPFAYLSASAMQRAGLMHVAGQRIDLPASLALNSILWAIALYGLWFLVNRLRRRSA